LILHLEKMEKDIFFRGKKLEKDKKFVN